MPCEDCARIANERDEARKLYGEQWLEREAAEARVAELEKLLSEDEGELDSILNLAEREWRSSYGMEHSPRCPVSVAEGARGCDCHVGALLALRDRRQIRKAALAGSQQEGE